MMTLSSDISFITLNEISFCWLVAIDESYDQHKKLAGFFLIFEVSVLMSFEYPFWRSIILVHQAEIFRSSCITFLSNTSIFGSWNIYRRYLCQILKF